MTNHLSSGPPESPLGRRDGAATYHDLQAGARRPARPLRALHVYSGNLFGGIEGTFLVYAKYANPGLWEPEYALCFDGALRRKLSSHAAVQYDLGPVRMRAPWSVARARKRLARLLQAERYDVMVTHSVWGQVLAAPVANAAGVRLVFHLHDAANGVHWLERLAKRYPPAFVVCNSQFTRGTLPRLYPGVPSAVVYNPVDLAATTVDTANRARLRESLATPDDAVVILQASRLQEWKGQRRLLRALAKLDPDGRSWVCWLAGGAQRPDEHRYELELRALARELQVEPRVRFLGQRSDVPALMEAADVFCQPNEAPEPFGVAFIEALNASLPVVTSAFGGALEIVTEACGILTPPRADDVAEALRGLLSDPAARARLGRGGKARARELCDPERQTEAIVKAFSAVTSARRDPHARAALSKGASGGPIVDLVVDTLDALAPGARTVVDLGCGQGEMGRRLERRNLRYIGCDLVIYDGFPSGPGIEFVEADLNRTPYPLASAVADVVLSVETIEHLENPRAFVRELVRICRPGGRVIFTTPNQLSLLSKLTLITRNQFNAFQEAPGLYPSHITALVERDLVHIAQECGLVDIEVRYTGRGRIPLTGSAWPVSWGLRGRAFSDNVLISGVVPALPAVSSRE